MRSRARWVTYAGKVYELRPVRSSTYKTIERWHPDGTSTKIHSAIDTSFEWHENGVRWERVVRLWDGSEYFYAPAAEVIDSRWQADNITRSIKRDVRVSSLTEAQAWLDANPDERPERLLLSPKSSSGETIALGHVLEKAEPGWKGSRDRGIVTRGPCQFGIENMWISPLPPSLGEIVVKTPGSSVHSNDHLSWRHVPRAEQTTEERYRSMCATPIADWSWHDDKEYAAKEQRSNDVLELLPADHDPHEFDEWPHDMYDALGYVVRWITSIEEENANLRAALGGYRL